VILVDTSVWIDHFSKGDDTLRHYLMNAEVLVHPMVIGELGMGNLRDRGKILGMLAELPQVLPASDAEVQGFVTAQNLFGIGIGYVDAHLLASVRLSPGSLLWTRDRRLAEAAASLGLSLPVN